MARTRFAAAALAASLSLGWAGHASAQDTPKDDALDRLLEKLEGNKPAPAGEAAPKPRKDEAKKDAPKDKDKAKETPKDKPKPAAEAEPKDKALDSLLEKLGETKEAPKTTGPAGGGETPDKADKPGGKPRQPEDKSADMIKEGQKPLDEHLEELTGRVKKKKNSQDQQQGQPGQPGQEGDADDSSPLGQAVKKMRQVETKLGETDTGEETRKTQGEIIKDLDTLIAQARKSGQKGGKPRKGGKPGEQPGDQQGDQPGSQPNAQGAGPMKPLPPKNASAMVGDKNTWGNLPAMLRDEMENAFRAEMLPKKSKQISRYYESINKKSLSPSSRGE
ncbi:MAG: hypothetical protein JWN86_4546 [Planctomycetota bacterium]|nr:hypothetical protein [Planctomycetota bacterium]